MAYDKKSFIMGLAAGLATRGVIETSTVGTPPTEGPYLTFSSHYSFTLEASFGKSWNGELEWSTNTNAWHIWDGSLITADIDNGLYVIYVRGRNNTYICKHHSTVRARYRWLLNGNEIRCDGDIRYLLDYENFETVQMSNYCFVGLFGLCVNLISAPRLPALVLAPHCYDYMFAHCTALQTAPELPALQAAEGCYHDMFSYCDSLSNVQAELPALTLARNCYDAMFKNCSSLQIAPRLPALTCPDYCYSYMFWESGLIEPPALPAMTLGYGCYDRMFAGCDSLIKINWLPATYLPQTCYYGMYWDCKKIKLSETREGDYQRPWRCPVEGNAEGPGATGSGTNIAGYNMFTKTGGTYTSHLSVNTTYYTSNEIV